MSKPAKIGRAAIGTKIRYGGEVFEVTAYKRPGEPMPELMEGRPGSTLPQIKIGMQIHCYLVKRPGQEHFYTIDKNRWRQEVTAP